MVADCEILRRRLAAVCGRYCGHCDALQNGSCCGCGYQLGQTRLGECPLFLCCVIERGQEHCGLCPDFPCEVFVTHAAPAEVSRRYRAVLRRAAIGTFPWLAEFESLP